MVKFEQLNISQDDRTLTIEASVLDESYYTDVYIDSIIIDDQTSYVENGPSTNPVYTYTFAGDRKNIITAIDTLELIRGIKNNLLFVYIVTKGNPAPDTPCGKDNRTVRGAVFNPYPFYLQSVQYLKQLGNDCQIPQHFINSILRMEAIEFSLKTSHYVEAIKLWKQFISGLQSIRTNNTCGCNG